MITRGPFRLRSRVQDFVQHHRSAVKALAIWIFPLALITAAALSLFFLNLLSPDQLSWKLRFAAIDSQTASSPQEAELLLRQLPRNYTAFATNREEEPFWFLFSLEGLDRKTTTIEFPSRHTQTLTCWQAGQPATPIAQANRHYTSGAVGPVKAGFAIPLKAVGHSDLLCRFAFIGPAKFTGQAWKTSDLMASDQVASRATGLLDGSLVTLAVCVAFIAVLYRDSTFLLFAAWLIGNMRMAAISGGWDMHGLVFQILSEHTFLVRKLTFAAYFALTVALFRKLFKLELARLKVRPLLVALNIGSGLIFAAAVGLPYKHFLPILWFLSPLAIGALLYLLGRILLTSKNRVAVWYLLSWAYTMASVVSEIIAAAFEIRISLSILNNVSGAIVSSLLATLAIAERLRSEREQKEHAKGQAVSMLRRFKEAYTVMPIGLFTIELNGRLTQFNPAFERMVDVEGVLGKHHRPSLQGIFGQTQFDRLLKVCLQSAEAETELSLGTDSTRSRCFSVRAFNKGNLLEGSIQDITARKAAERRLQHLADHDPLTDLLNRRGLERELEAAFDNVRLGGSACLAYLDLDRFKLVNDLFGHIAGDHVLRQIAERLRSGLGSSHTLARIGGDEFVFILKNRTSAEARVLCESILRNIDQAPLQFSDKAFNVTGCVGLIALDKSMTAHDALTACDRACSDAKKTGGSHVVIYDDQSGQLERHLEEIHLAAAFKQKLPVDRFFVQMQPIVSFRSAFSSMNYEVLLRMRGEDGSVISPAKFVGAAERNGIMAGVDRWVLTHVLEWLDAHPEHLARLGYASVNLSAASLNDERFVEDSIALIRSYPRAAARICFEITESVALYDLKNTRRYVDRVKSFGSKVALDDFGAGYTSFNYLKDLPADIVKIDGSFIQGLHADSANRAITRAVVDLSHQIGMSVVAEWTETAAEIETLMRMGVDYGQGFGLARPMSPDALAAATSAGALVNDAAVLALLQHSAGRLPALAHDMAVLG